MTRILKKIKRQKMIIKSGNPKTSDDLLRSDSRIKGGIKDICILCDKPRKLLLSHIVPRWMYRWSKAEGDGRMVGIYPSIGIETIEQDGTKHYLLCEECEQILGDAERYISLLMSGDIHAYQKLGIELNNDEFIGLDPKLIQRFILGVAYKAHYASGPPFQRVKISESILESIRIALLKDAPDDETFPIVAMRFVSQIIPGADPRAMLFPYYMTTNEQWSYFELLAAGWSWILFLDINDSFPAFLYEMRIRQGAPFKIPIGDITQHRFISNAMKKKKP